MKNFYSLLFITLIPVIAHSQPDIEWAKCLGGSSSEYARSIQQTTDGGYIVAGYTNSTDGDVTGNHGSDDYWIVKLNTLGDTLWTKCYGGSYWDYAYSIQQTIDGGFIVAGWTHSTDGDVSGNHGYRDFWIVKLNTSGDILWKKCLGGSMEDFAFSVQQTSDGGYIVAGSTESDDGDVSGNHGFMSKDFWIVKLNSLGDTLWTKCLGGSYSDEALSIQQTTDGGYIVAGYTNSTNGDVSGNHGSDDYWIVKLNTYGDTVWTKCLGGSSSDYAQSIQQTTDGGYIVAGNTSSIDGDVSGNHGSGDCWIVKLSPGLGIEEVHDNNLITIHPNPAKDLINIEVENIKDYSIEIVDIQGKVIYNKELNLNFVQIDVSGYPQECIQSE